jgi:hypothetical protein
MRVDFLEREMSIDEPQPAGEPVQEQLDHRRGLLAIRTLEIAVLDDHDTRVERTQRMIDRCLGCLQGER